MRARVSHGTMFVMITLGLGVAGTRTATAQALCPHNLYAQLHVPGLDALFQLAPPVVTVDADLRGFGGTLPGGTWRMPTSAGPALDGLSLEGVSFTRRTEPALGSTAYTYDVVVDLRAWDSLVTDLELVVVDGERRLRLGALEGIEIRCEAKSVARTFSIADRDFEAFFAGGKVPRLRVTRSTGGC